VQAFGCSREVQFLGNGDEVAKQSQLHGLNTTPVLGDAYQHEPTGRGAALTVACSLWIHTREVAVSGTVKMNLEIDIIPVSDVDRAKGFYERLGWRFDDDVAPMDGLRIVQFTPPGSAASITFGLGLTTAAPGSASGGLVVSDIEAAHAEIVGRGVEVSDIWHGPPFPVEARQPGPDPERASYGSFCSFTDPDGNTWIVQEVTTRRPGRI
jgi:catechol 2,3-dioxygenase-like lactoylglutathione lyase family enzyme